MATGKVQVSKNYDLFTRGDNRPLDLTKHRKLHASMKLYGFLKCFPIVVVRNAKGHLIVKDGQHRLAIARELRLPVYWIEADEDFDVALVNSTAKTWLPRDYAEKYAADGHPVYQEGLAFATDHKLPIGIAFALLAGTTGFKNIHHAFITGTWTIKDRPWADAVAALYCPLVSMAPVMRNARFLEACMAVCRVPDFDPKRVFSGAEHCREKLVSYSTRDAYLDLLEDLYNFKRRQLVGLKAAALMAMKERNPTKNRAKTQEQK